MKKQMSSRVNSAIFNSLSCGRGLFREISILLIILLLLPAISFGFASFTRAGDIPAVKLTAEERTWLENNPEKLTLLFNIEFPPIEFSSASGTFIGMGADIIAMVEKRLGITFIKTPSNDWNEHLSALESGACAIAPTIVSTQERQRYAFFTTPYAVVPVVIITSQSVRGWMTIDDLSGRSVAVVSGYATEKYVRDRSKGRFEVAPVSNVSEGLHAVSFGEVDALVENLAVAGYFIDMEGIPNLRVAGKTDYTFAWSIGVSRMYPLLFSSIQKALDTITESELETIRNQWISLDISGWMSPETRKMLQVINVFVTLLLFCLVGISLFLRRRLKENIVSLKSAQQELLDQSDLLRLATEATPAGIWDFYPAKKIGYLYKQWYIMFGYNPVNKEITMDEWRYFIHPDDLAFSENILMEYINSGGRSQFETKFRVRKADNTWCWVLSRGRAIAWDKNGNPTRVIGLHLNIQNIKETQDETAQSEAKFRAIFENAPYPIVITALEDGRYLEANKSFLDSRGISREELLGLRTKDFAFIREEETADVMDTLMKTGSVKNRETTVGKKDGTHGHITYSSVLLEIQGQKQILSMTVDVTERKRAEEALKKSEARFRSLFMNAPIPLINLTLEGKVIAVNDRLSKVLGYTLEEIPDMDRWWKTIYPDPEHRSRMKSTWEKAVSRATVHNSSVEPDEYRVTCKDGTVLTMIIGGNVIEDSLLVSFFDITELREKESALKQSMELLRATFNATTDGILVVNKELKVTQANQQFYKMWHIPPDLQKSDDDVALREFILDQLEDPSGFQSKVDTLYHSRIQDMYEIAFKDGRFFECYSAPMVMEGKETGRVWDFRDISERKRAEEARANLQGQLLQSQKLEAVGVLAGGVAHDFNNMLGAIIGYTELTMGEMDSADPFRKNLDRILDAAQRSVNLTRQLLAFARKQTIEPVIFDLNESVETMLKMIRRLIGENIELSWLPGSGACTVRMDPSQLDQILVNLCVNAKDAIADVGRVSIETDTVYFDEAYGKSHPGVIPGEYALLSVSDNGKGMDKETMDHIFEPFFTTKGVGQGTGLGLATVYGIVKQNEGFINAYSEPGKGTTFRIYIPLNAAEEVAAIPQRAGDIPRSRGETILVVEDDPILLEMSIKMLQQLGYSVLSAAAPNEAIRIAEENSPRIHLFITDVIMPEMNGRDLAERLKSIRPEMKDLFMSGYTADVIAHQGVLDKGVNFIQKPFSLKDLATKIREVLD